ncbi:MAG: hypothetical protein ACE10K_15905, partial [Rhodothermales bacterium]
RDDNKGRYCCEIVLFSFLDAYAPARGQASKRGVEAFLLLVFSTPQLIDSHTAQLALDKH